MFSFDQMRMKPLNKVVSKYYVPVNFSFPSLGQDVEKLLLNRNNYKYTQCFALGGRGGISSCSLTHQVSPTNIKESLS